MLMLELVATAALWENYRHSLYLMRDLEMITDDEVVKTLARTRVQIKSRLAHHYPGPCDGDIHCWNEIVFEGPDPYTFETQRGKIVNVKLCSFHYDVSIDDS